LRAYPVHRRSALSRSVPGVPDHCPDPCLDPCRFPIVVSILVPIILDRQRSGRGSGQRFRSTKIETKIKLNRLLFSDQVLPPNQKHLDGYAAAKSSSYRRAGRAAAPRMIDGVTFFGIGTRERATRAEDDWDRMLLVNRSRRPLSSTEQCDKVAKLRTSNPGSAVFCRLGAPPRHGLCLCNWFTLGASRSPALPFGSRNWRSSRVKSEFIDDFVGVF
jgi:hypothetical protein